MDSAKTLPFKTGAAGLTAAGLLLWLDKTVPQAGMWMLLVLSVSVGFVHGALDAILLPRSSASRFQTGMFLTAYLLSVLLLGWLLSSAISLALWLLLVMSVWHFGEPYGRWHGVSSFQSVLTRAVVGGAPVMLPAWLASEQFAAALAGVVPDVGVRGWHALSWLWLALFGCWLLPGLTRTRELRDAWFELLGCAILFLVFSPLMAFALYFGAYHAPLHIYRVWRAHANSVDRISIRVTIAAITVTSLFAWLLGAGLAWYLMGQVNAPRYGLGALSWLIVAFAALTAPHLVLISLNAAFLTHPAAQHERSKIF